MPISRQEAKERGLPRFFTGKPCKRGHVAERWTSNTICVLCHEEGRSCPEAKKRQRAYHAEWRKRPEVRERRRAQDRRRKSTPEAKEKLREYLRRPDVRERKRQFMLEYNKRPESRDRSRRHSAKPDAKAKKRLHRQRPEVKARDLATTRERQARKTRQTPPWAVSERDQIAALYAEAVSLSKETGVPHEVDHIVPLKHPRVSGLHCLANLQVISQSDNRRKHNKFAP